MSATLTGRRRTSVRVHGTVQGVGFRPYVYRLAGELELAGYVLNDTEGVLLEVEGEPEAVASFLARLPSEAPPLARVADLICDELAPTGAEGFEIRASPSAGRPDAPITPDSATCPDCLRELMEPADRRYRYPFVNCTNCGPRFTIVRGIPYDRPLTTMAPFTMCPDCQAEYEDPGDRRFHAQPNACPVCGPAVRLLAADGSPAPDEIAAAGVDAVAATAAALRDGAIVAVKGIGGYHLACRADDETAVAALRARKHREDRPFALMAATLEEAETLAVLGECERRLLSGPERPIVLAPRRPDAPVAPSVAPGAPELGLMLPYTPLHHLLLADAGCALVMTSGNVSDEPIAFRDGDARARLSPIADLILTHDREIETRTDDSVMRAMRIAGPGADGVRPAFVRRSRGYVPDALPLPVPDGRRPARRQLLACGAELKSTFAVAREGRAWVSHHIGDLQNFETLSSFTEGIAHFERLFAVAPETLVHDLHPEYLSTKYAVQRAEEADGALELVGVQHHHAHLAACLAEHGETGPAVGAIYDGTGYGTDGTIWGGELLAGSLHGFRRAGALRAARLPGGERAVREPWRMGCAWLTEVAGTSGDVGPVPARLRGEVEERMWAQVASLARSGIGAAPVTTSAGRLFDAVSALAGVRARVTYEGQAAIELEAACDPDERGRYELPVLEAGGRLVLDAGVAVAAVAADAERGEPVGAIAARFHAALATATVEALVALAAAERVEIAVLSGGVFLNRRLLEACAAGLARAGLRVLVPERLPAGDGGISYGQAAIAAAREESG